MIINRWILVWIHWCGRCINTVCDFRILVWIFWRFFRFNRNTYRTRFVWHFYVIRNSVNINRTRVTLRNFNIICYSIHVYCTRVTLRNFYVIGNGIYIYLCFAILWHFHFICRNISFNFWIYARCVYITLCFNIGFDSYGFSEFWSTAHTELFVSVNLSKFLAVLFRSFIDTT